MRENESENFVTVRHFTPALHNINLYLLIFVHNNHAAIFIFKSENWKKKIIRFVAFLCSASERAHAGDCCNIVHYIKYKFNSNFAIFHFILVKYSGTVCTAQRLTFEANDNTWAWAHSK